MSLIWMFTALIDALFHFYLTKKIKAFYLYEPQLLKGNWVFSQPGSFVVFVLMPIIYKSHWLQCGEFGRKDAARHNGTKAFKSV